MSGCDATPGFGEAVNVVVVTIKIVWFMPLEVEVAKPAFPEYVAVMLSDPPARPLVANVATPEEFSVPVPSSAEPL